MYSIIFLYNSILWTLCVCFFLKGKNLTLIMQKPESKIVKENSVSVILLAGGKGKRMGVSHLLLLLTFLIFVNNFSFLECLHMNEYECSIIFIYSFCLFQSYQMTMLFVMFVQVGQHAKAISSAFEPANCIV